MAIQSRLLSFSNDQPQQCAHNWRRDKKICDNLHNTPIQRHWHFFLPASPAMHAYDDHTSARAGLLRTNVCSCLHWCTLHRDSAHKCLDHSFLTTLRSLPQLAYSMCIRPAAHRTRLYDDTISVQPVTYDDTSSTHSNQCTTINTMRNTYTR